MPLDLQTFSHKFSAQYSAYALACDLSRITIGKSASHLQAEAQSASHLQLLPDHQPDSLQTFVFDTAFLVNTSKGKGPRP